MHLTDAPDRVPPYLYGIAGLLAAVVAGAFVAVLIRAAARSGALDCCDHPDLDDTDDEQPAGVA